MNTSGLNALPVKTVSAAKISIFLIVILSVLTAFDAMAIDMYLPALLHIQNALNTNPGLMQISVSVFIIGLGLGQGLYGPIVDNFGQRKPLLLGTAIFAAASLMLAFSPNAYVFLLCRFLQGIGGAAGIVIPRVVVADIYDAKSSAKIYSILMQIAALAPVIAPIAGSLLLKSLGWQSIFCMLGVFGFVILIASAYSVPEKKEINRTASFSVLNIIRSYKPLLSNGYYLKNVLCLGFVHGTLFTYISGASFMFVNYYGVSETMFSIIFSVNALGLIGAGIIAVAMMKKMKTTSVISLGMAGHVIIVTAFMSSILLGINTLISSAVLIFLMTASLSFLFGGLTAEAMFSVSKDKSGSASALLGVAQYVIGGAASFIIGLLHNGTLIPMASIMLFCAVAAAASIWFKTKENREEEIIEPEAA